jgi:diguanylate cyclase (GGDEF)-like protein
VACRYGGEEFLVVLPGAGLADAQARAEHWRRAFQALRVAEAGAVLQATLSLGVAACPEHGRSGDAVVRQADQALYRAKETGRNRVVMA